MTGSGGAPAPGRVISTAGLASLSVVAGGALWGLFWVPVRMVGELGLTGAWPGFVVYVSAFVILTPFALATRMAQVSLGQLAVAGLLTGAAFAFYSTAIALTDVLRAILFFYLTPVWGTMIGVMFLGSVALLAGEPFGLFEALGAALILGASLTEVLGNRP